MWCCVNMCVVLSHTLSFSCIDVHVARFGVLACLGNAGGITMPWLVGVVADVSGLRWGLSIAASTPLLMSVPSIVSLSSSAITHAICNRLPCVYYMKNRAQPAAEPNVAPHQCECPEEADTKPMSVLQSCQLHSANSVLDAGLLTKFAILSEFSSYL